MRAVAVTFWYALMEMQEREKKREKISDREKESERENESERERERVREISASKKQNKRGLLYNWAKNPFDVRNRIK